MRKKLLLRFCLILSVMLTAYSCRTDQFPEKEAYNNSSKFQLTSKRISLDEAKHKKQLLPELTKAETEIKAKAKSNAHGKTVDFGNGITINTDDIIYIENGPDFHTYTFKVNRENAPADAPLENLLLTPQTDGSYRVFLITLNLSESDKAKIENRQFVNYKNKAQVTELASVNFSSIAQRSNCTPEYYSYPVPCADAGYRHLPGESCQLSGSSGAAYWGTGVFWNCQNIPGPVDHVITPIDNSGPGGGAGGDGPDPCMTVAGNPTEVGIIDENGCHVGGATQPNDPPVKGKPCDRIVAESSKAKEYYNKTKFQGRKAEISTNVNVTNAPEKSFSFGDNANGEQQVTNIITGTDSKVDVVSKSNQFTVRGAGHIHTPGGDEAPPSFADVYTLLEANTDNPEFKYYFTFVYDGSEYVFTITDTYKLNNFKANNPRHENVDDETNKWKDYTNLGKDAQYVTKYLRKQGKLRDGAYELAMAFVLRKYNTGIGLSKKDSNGDFKPIFVEELTDPTNPKKKIYQQTDNCNL